MTHGSHPTNWQTGFAVRIGKWKFYNYAPKREEPTLYCSAGFSNPELGCHNYVFNSFSGWGRRKTTVDKIPNTNIFGTLKLEMILLHHFTIF